MNHERACKAGVEITDIPCDAFNSCPTGLELGCYVFPDLGARCAKRDPCSYYECPTDTTTCTLTASFPGRVICSKPGDGGGNGGGVGSPPVAH